MNRNTVQNILSRTVEENLLHTTDTGNAQRFTELFGDTVRFDHRRGRCLVWKSHRWIPDSTGEVSRLAIRTAKQRYEDAEQISDLKVRASEAAWAIVSESKAKVDACLGLAKNLLPVADAGNHWDEGQMLLGCENGVVDLATGKLRDGQPDDRLTMTTGITFDYDASCPRWEQFINEVFGDDEQLVGFIHRALGYSLTGKMDEQVVFIAHGAGRNGKTTLFETVRHILGDYGHTAPARMFLKNESLQSNDIAAIENKRFIIASETLTSARLDEQRLKSLSGGDSMTARFLYKEYFTMQPQGKVWLFLNHLPKVDDDSFAFWRRVRLVPFLQTFTGDRDDKTLPAKLKEEAPGILNWLIQGCLEWQQHGLGDVPASIISATEQYRIESDPLLGFLTETCSTDKEGEVLASSLYSAYVEWAGAQKMNNRETLSSTAFGRKMGEKFSRRHTREGWVYRGVKIGNGDGFVTGSSHDVTGFEQFPKTTAVISSREGFMEMTSNPSHNVKQNDTLESNDNLNYTVTGYKSFHGPITPCFMCQGTEFWTRRDGEKICGRCHPKP